MRSRLSWLSREGPVMRFLFFLRIRLDGWLFAATPASSVFRPGYCAGMQLSILRRASAHYFAASQCY